MRKMIGEGGKDGRVERGRWRMAGHPQSRAQSQLPAEAKGAAPCYEHGYGPWSVS